MVLDKTLKGIHDVRLDNRKVLCGPGPRAKYFERLFFCLSINYKAQEYFEQKEDIKFEIKILKIDISAKLLKIGLFLKKLYNLCIY